MYIYLDCFLAAFLLLLGSRPLLRMAFLLPFSMYSLSSSSSQPPKSSFFFFLAPLPSSLSSSVMGVLSMTSSSSAAAAALSRAAEVLGGVGPILWNFAS